MPFRTWRRPTLSLLLLAGAVPLVLVPLLPAAPVSAVETCRGFPATHTGGAGDDRILGTNGVDVIVGLGGDDTIYGFGGDDFICSGGGNDYLNGGGGNNQLLPGPDDDRVLGNDTTDKDLVIYEDAPSAVKVDLVAGRAVGGSGQDSLTDIGSVVGSFHDDTIWGDEGGNTLSGNYGHDLLFGRAGPDHVRGGDGDDRVFGDVGDDVLEGMGQRDALFGGPGHDTIDGSQSGAAASREGDVVVYENDAVHIDLQAGHAWGDDGTDLLLRISDVVGSSQDDEIWGTDAANTIEGRGGNDLVDGRGGGDLLHDGPGDDTYLGGGDADTLSYAWSATPVVVILDPGIATGSGSDQISEVENLVGSAGPDQLIGDDRANRLRGGPGDDVIVGDAVNPDSRGGNDILEGQAGTDVLQPGAGDDHVTGGSGADTVRFTDAIAPVTASLPERAAIGQGSDVLGQVEHLIGGQYDDHLTGSGADNQLRGRGGADILVGRGGSDLCDGGSGADTARACETVTAVP